MARGVRHSAPDAEAPRAKIFISYSRRDMAFADRLEAALKVRGFDTLIDRTEIYALEDWWKRIEALIAKADTIVFVLSPDAVTSEICQREVTFAASLAKRLAPVVFRHVDDKAVPQALARLNFIFFDDDERFELSANNLGEALDTDIEWIREHTEFGQAARRWSDAGRPGPRGLLLRSPMLEQAERWIASRPRGAPMPTEATRAFIAESRSAATQRRNVLIGTLISGLLAALGLAGLAYWQRGVAIEQRGIAQQNEMRANEERDSALLTQSRFLADLASTSAHEGDASSATLLACEALPDDTTKRPYAPQAESALYRGYERRQEFLVLHGHEKGVWSAAFSPDGRRIVTASDDKTARLWDAERGQEVQILRGHSDHVLSAAFSPDGEKIVTASDDRTVGLWDARSGRRIFVMRGHGINVRNATFSPDGKRLLSTSADETMLLWDVESGQAIRTIDLTDGSLQLAPLQHTIGRANFSPDGKRILLAYDSTIRLWDAETAQEIRVLRGHEKLVKGAAFSPDGRRIVSASYDRTVRLWDLESGEQIRVLTGHQDSVESVAFSPDGKRVVSVSDDRTVRLWNAESGEQIQLMGGHEDKILDVAFSPDGRRIVTASDDGSARIWNLETSPEIAVLRGHESDVRRASFSPDSRQIVTASYDHTARLWDVESGQQIRVLRGHDDSVQSAAFSPDGDWILTASYDRTARVWDAASGQQIRILRGHTDKIRSGGFSPDGRRVVTVSDDRTVRLWDAESGQEIHVLRGHERAVLTAEFSPDGKLILTASDDGTARLWDVESGREAGVLLADERRVSSAAFSPDGKLAATTSENTVRLWDVMSHRQIQLLRGHEGHVMSAVFSPDGKHVLTASDSRMVESFIRRREPVASGRLWDVERGYEVWGFGKDKTAGFAALSPDGKRLATGNGLIGTLRILRAFPTTQALIDEAKQVTPRCLTRVQREKAFLEPEPPAWCVEMEKWPYHTQEWKDWLNFRRSNLRPPLPDTSEWSDWLTAHKSN